MLEIRTRNLYRYLEAVSKIRSRRSVTSVEKMLGDNSHSVVSNWTNEFEQLGIIKTTKRGRYRYIRLTDDGKILLNVLRNIVKGRIRIKENHWQFIPGGGI